MWVLGIFPHEYFKKIGWNPQKPLVGFEDLLKKTYGNTLALFISSWSSFVAASIQEFAIKFGRNLDELYQNWLCTFDALFKSASKVHQNVLKVHQRCIKSASSLKVGACFLRRGTNVVRFPGLLGLQHLRSHRNCHDLYCDSLRQRTLLKCNCCSGCKAANRWRLCAPNIFSRHLHLPASIVWKWWPADHQ